MTVLSWLLLLSWLTHPAVQGVAGIMLLTGATLTVIGTVAIWQTRQAAGDAVQGQLDIPVPSTAAPGDGQDPDPGGRDEEVAMALLRPDDPGLPSGRTCRDDCPCRWRPRRVLVVYDSIVKAELGRAAQHSQPRPPITGGRDEEVDGDA